MVLTSCHDYFPLGVFFTLVFNTLNFVVIEIFLFLRIRLKDAFQKLSLILKNRNISMTTKFRVLKTYVWSTLTYGCECWTITSDIEKKIEAAEMWFIRRMLRISWTEKKPNVNVLREGNVQKSLLKTIRKRQMEFLGHVCRRRGLEFLSLS